MLVLSLRSHYYSARHCGTAPATTSAAPPSIPLSVSAVPRQRPTTKLTALQKHVMFFDQDGDGKVTVGEADTRARLWFYRSSAFAFAINAFGVATGALYAPLTVDIENIARVSTAMPISAWMVVPMPEMKTSSPFTIPTVNNMSRRIRNLLHAQQRRRGFKSRISLNCAHRAGRR